MLDHNINQGVAWLDEKYPGWLDVINVDSLDMTEAHSCILGQTHALLASNPSSVWSNILLKEDLTNEDAIDLAFNSRATHGGAFSTLTAAWKQKIRILRRDRGHTMAAQTHQPTDQPTIMIAVTYEEYIALRAGSVVIEGSTYYGTQSALTQILMRKMNIGDTR